MKYIFISLLVIVLGGVGIMVLSSGKASPDQTAVNNVTVVDGKQIIELTAKGGFAPAKSVAKSGVPTVLRLNTNGTFDCSSSVRIPSMNISKVLPQTGTTDIDLGTQQAGIIYGTCGMGMYPFQIQSQG